MTSYTYTQTGSGNGTGGDNVLWSPCPLCGSNHSVTECRENVPVPKPGERWERKGDSGTVPAECMGTDPDGDHHFKMADGYHSRCVSGHAWKDAVISGRWRRVEPQGATVGMGKVYATTEDIKSRMATEPMTQSDADSAVVQAVMGGWSAAPRDFDMKKWAEMFKESIKKPQQITVMHDGCNETVHQPREPILTPISIGDRYEWTPPTAQGPYTWTVTKIWTESRESAEALDYQVGFAVTGNSHNGTTTLNLKEVDRMIRGGEFVRVSQPAQPREPRYCGTCGMASSSTPCVTCLAVVGGKRCKCGRPIVITADMCGPCAMVPCRQCGNRVDPKWPCNYCGHENGVLYIPDDFPSARKIRQVAWVLAGIALWGAMVWVAWMCG